MLLSLFDNVSECGCRKQRLTEELVNGKEISAGLFKTSALLEEIKSSNKKSDSKFLPLFTFMKKPLYFRKTIYNGGPVIILKCQKATI